METIIPSGCKLLAQLEVVNSTCDFVLIVFDIDTVAFVGMTNDGNCYAIFTYSQDELIEYRNINAMRRCVKGKRETQ